MIADPFLGKISRYRAVNWERLTCIALSVLYFDNVFTMGENDNNLHLRDYVRISVNLYVVTEGNRTFSTWKPLKTDLHNTTNDDRLTGLLL